MIRFPIQNAVAAFIAVAFFAPVLWMLLDRMEPYQITNGRVHPSVPTVGSDVTVTWDVRVLRTCQTIPSSVTRVIVDRQGYRHVSDFDTGSEQSPNQTVIQRLVSLPENIVGPVQYSSTRCYQCNPLQVFWPVCVNTPPVNFTIREASR